MRPLGYQLAFLSDITLGNVLGHFVEYWRQLPTLRPRMVPRLCFIGLLSLAMAPLRVWERVRWWRALRQTELCEPPIFVLGHWRSGTTHLHNLLACDPRLGFVTMLQAAFPGAFLSWGFLAGFIFERLLPSTRPMDNVTWTLQTPQEEEIALSKLVPQAFFANLLVPQTMAERFGASILLGETSKRARARWRSVYHHLLIKASHHASGKRLVLKNPANTGRLDLLTDMYPEGCFVFIHRDPYDVFVSMRHFYGTLFPLLRLQSVSPAQIDDLILEGYRALMTRYLEARPRIPEGHLLELSFEALERAPVAAMERIYAGFELDFKGAREAVEEHLEAVAGYKKNHFDIDAQTIERINGLWGFAFDEWGYERRGQ